MLVYEAVGETLRRLGVEVFFGLMGRANMRILLHMRDRCGMRYVGARHEASALSMADGYARATQKLGVCTVTLGPGVTHGLTGLVEAAKGRTPLLLLTGDSPSVRVRDNQFVDQGQLHGAVGVATQRLRSPDTVVDDLKGAVRRAIVGRRPVAVPIPLDLQERPTKANVEALEPILLPPLPRAPDAVVAQMADLLAAARKPLIIAGRGAASEPARRALAAIADRVGALLATTMPANGLFAGHPFSVGMVGVHMSAASVRLVAEADTLLAFGASLNQFTTRAGHLFPRLQAIVHCDLDELAVAGAPVALRAIGDAGATAEALLAELERRRFTALGFHTADVRGQIEAKLRETWPEDPAGNGVVDPRAVVTLLDRWLPRRRAIVPDTGHASGYAIGYLSVPERGSGVYPFDFQAIGLALGMAIGVAVALPDRITVAVVGDGSLLMALGEVETAVRHRLPLLILVMNDAAFGAEVRELQMRGLPIDAALFPDVDFAAVGRAMGAQGLTVRRLDDLQAVRSWIADPQAPIVVDCKLDPRVPADWFVEAIGGESAYMRRPAPGY